MVRSGIQEAFSVSTYANRPSEQFYGDKLTLWLPDQIFNSPCCQPYNSYDGSPEKLVLDQPIIPKRILFFILITYLVDIVLLL